MSPVVAAGAARVTSTPPWVHIHHDAHATACTEEGAQHTGSGPRVPRCHRDRQAGQSNRASGRALSKLNGHLGWLVPD